MAKKTVVTVEPGTGSSTVLRNRTNHFFTGALLTYYSGAPTVLIILPLVHYNCKRTILRGTQRSVLKNICSEWISSWLKNSNRKSEKC